MRISVRHIQDVIAADFGIPAEKLREPMNRGQGKDFRNARRYSWPRQYAMLLARELTPHSLPVIGNLFNRDHTTVLDGIRAASKRVESDKKLALKLEARALLLACEPTKVVDAGCIGFPAKPVDEPVAAETAIAA